MRRQCNAFSSLCETRKIKPQRSAALKLINERSAAHHRSKKPPRRDLFGAKRSAVLLQPQGRRHLEHNLFSLGERHRGFRDMLPNAVFFAVENAHITSRIFCEQCFKDRFAAANIA